MKFISPEQIVIYFINFVFIFFLVVALKISYLMIKKFDFSKSTSFQYSLEKRNVLVSTIVSFFIFLKVPLLFYFLFYLDSLAPSIPGAMCAVGVLNSTPYGAYLIIVKVAVLFMLVWWFYINKFDLNTYGFKYTKLKYKFLILISFAIFLEFLLEINLFNNISPEKIVSCCGSVFGKDVKYFSSFLFNLNDNLSLLITVVTFLLLAIFFKTKNYTFYGLASLIFLIVAVYSLIDFFSTYIYELPTHRCPFCILQKDYGYIGYVIYFLLLTGTFYGSSLLVLKNILDNTTKISWAKSSFFMIFCYLLIVGFYVVKYYMVNGVWLKG